MTTTRWIFGACLGTFLAYSPKVQGAEPAPRTPGTRGAIERGIAFLTTDAVAWKNEHGCVSCHHAALVAWALHEAKSHGHAVDQTVLSDLTTGLAEAGDGTTGVARPPNVPKAINTKAVYFALALEADPTPNATARAGLKRMLETVKRDQTDNGSWAWWPQTRPPIFGVSDEDVSTTALLALAGADPGDEAAKAALAKGFQWLRAAHADNSAQTLAMRLVLNRRLGRPAEELALLAERIRARQNPDGGWSQAPIMASDAWATGHALFALAHVPVPDESAARAIARGQAFLVRTQEANGSWPMTSRPIEPGGAGSNSLVPITGAGAAWAVLGLVRTE